MRLDVSKPEGRTTAALQTAKKWLKREGRHAEAFELEHSIASMEEDGVGDAVARKMITEFTFGAIEFFDSREMV